jgi:hypothetical protein
MSQQAFKYLVLGGGPSGIITVGKLLDNGVKNIAWVDQHFSVGRLGQYYGNVPSNTKVKSFLSVLTGCQSFNFQQLNQVHKINHIDPEQTCQLSEVIQPLQSITNHLRKNSHVTSFQTEVQAINWLQTLDQIQIDVGFKLPICAENVILASGSTPIVGHLLPHQTLIPLDDALDPQRLAAHIVKTDIVGIYGVSHSGMLVLRNLVNLNLNQKPKRIMSFSNRKVRYAVDKGSYYIYDNTGLKGEIAQWSKDNYDVTTPQFQKVTMDLALGMKQCNKIIYATGFERNTIQGLHPILLEKYNNQTGRIAKNLYGVGIAFPNQVLDASGGLESNVGLLKFMRHLDTNLSAWLED